MYSISFQEDSLLPRERLVAEGAEQLSNQELLSILIRTGNKKETVFQVSQRILSTISSLNDLRNMTLQELQSISILSKSFMRRKISSEHMTISADHLL